MPYAYILFSVRYLKLAYSLQHVFHQFRQRKHTFLPHVLNKFFLALPPGYAMV